MRSVAPDSAGAAASQNSWLVEYLKPSAGRFTATTLQTCQMAKARNSAGTEIHRLSLATASPSCSQKCLSSGVQSVSRRPVRLLLSIAELADIQRPPSNQRDAGTVPEVPCEAITSVRRT